MNQLRYFAVFTSILLLCSNHCHALRFTLTSAPSSASPASANSTTPIVLWHGMGDTYKHMETFAQQLRDTIPGVYVVSIFIGNGDEEQDRKASYLDNINRQIEEVCEKLATDLALSNGFNAIGFSQGGQFFRAYVQRCNRPRVKTLVTLGAQHMGVSDAPHCSGVQDGNCRLMHFLIKTGVYWKYTQENVVQSTYFCDPSRYDQYLSSSIFLPDINNEISVNKTYISNLAKLDKMVMVQFTEDTIVVPRQSSHFGFWKDGAVASFRELSIYKNLGLREMEAENKLVFLNWPGDHLQFSMDRFITEIVHIYLSQPQ